MKKLVFLLAFLVSACSPRFVSPEAWCAKNQAPGDARYDGPRAVPSVKNGVISCE